MRDGWTYQPGRHGPTVPQLTLSTLTFAAFILFVIIIIIVSNIKNEGNHDDDDDQIGRGGKENDMEHWQSLSASASSKNLLHTVALSNK